jgi:hypothetical protein
MFPLFQILITRSVINDFFALALKIVLHFNADLYPNHARPPGKSDGSESLELIVNTAFGILTFIYTRLSI